MMFWSILSYPQINPVAISFGVISMRWYGLAYAAGALFSVWYIQSLLRRNNLWTEQQNKYNRIHINDDIQGIYAFWIVVGLILGGHIFYYILYHSDVLLYFPLHILYFWEGGMSFHGAFFGVFLSLFLLSRIYKFSFWVFSDLLATSAPFGIFLGRIANFINGELFGKVSWMPWSMVFPSGGNLPRHPSQLYEAFLEGIVLFLIMQVIVYRGALKKTGFATGVFICGYAISRIFVEFFREPDAQLGYIMGEWITMGMVLSFPMLIIGIWCIVRAIILEKKAFLNTELNQKIVNLIKSNGPITVDQYFMLCLSDAEFGYYTTRDPFGVSGDFITAPEISQIFGEMLAIFLILSWEKHGFPRLVRLVEMGPGRGTMMADIIRAISYLSPDFFSVLSIHLMENSERLRLVQKQQLSCYIDKVNWCLNLSDVPSGFTFIVANEFFDSLPIKQFIVTKNGIRERMIDINHNEVLVFGEGDQEIEENHFMCSNCAPGSIFETSPCRDNEMVSVADRLSCNGGTAIIIDYGHFQSSMGDTLQAVKDHKYCSILMNPGQADLTSHVDFQRLASLAVRNKLYINGCTTQRVFLEGLGIWQRMFCLMRKSGHAKILLDSVRRLLGTVSDKKSMGELFKVLVVSHKRIDLIPFVN